MVKKVSKFHKLSCSSSEVVFAQYWGSLQSTDFNFIFIHIKLKKGDTNLKKNCVCETLVYVFLKGYMDVLIKLHVYILFYRAFSTFLKIEMF